MSFNLLLLPDDLDASLAGRSAIALINAGELAAAEAECRLATQSAPQDVCPKAILASLLFSRGMVDEALTTLESLRRTAPNSYAGHLNAGNLLLKLGRDREAVEMLRHAVRMLPRLAIAHYLLGRSTQSLSSNAAMLNEGREHFRVATELKPDWAEAYYYHGLFSLYSSREQEAEISLRRCLELDSDCVEAQFHLGYILLEQDRPDEAVVALRRVLEMSPGHERASEWLERLSDGPGQGARRRVARYPRSSQEFGEIAKVIREYIVSDFSSVSRFLTPESQVFALGSCFAGNMAHALQGYGVSAEFVNYAEEINSTYANRYFLQWLEGGADVNTAPFEAFFGEEYRLRMRAVIERADVVIISLGVAPCFFSKATNEFVPTLGANLHVSLRSSEYCFRTTTVAENVANLRAMVNAIRKMNSRAKFILTVSPVPLKATFERGSAIVADCVSKSTLRVAAHEFMAGQDGSVIYWPSFEIVRWCGGHFGQVFGNDDGSPLHVSNKLVEVIIEQFIRTFGSMSLNSLVDLSKSPERRLAVGD